MASVPGVPGAGQGIPALTPLFMLSLVHGVWQIALFICIMTMLGLLMADSAVSKQGPALVRCSILVVE